MDTIETEIGINPDRVYTEFKQEIMNEINDIEQEHTAEAKDEEKTMPPKLLIFDAVIIELAKPRHLNISMKAIYNRRHLGYCIIITGLKSNALPKKLRVSLSNRGFLVLFKTQNKKELDDLHQEIVDLNKNEFEKILEYTFPDDEYYNFLHARFDKPLSQSFHKNFNTLRLKVKK